jgi:hypothetical protein
VLGATVCAMVARSAINAAPIAAEGSWPTVLVAPAIPAWRDRPTIPGKWLGRVSVYPLDLRCLDLLQALHALR